MNEKEIAETIKEMQEVAQMKPVPFGDGKEISFTELCEKCGSPNFIWCVDSPLWNEVMRDPYLESIVCPTCFILNREDKLGRSGVWKLVLEFDTPTMDRKSSSATKCAIGQNGNLGDEQ
jgi:hypothetical protein